MDPINQSSDNTIAGHTAADDIPNDGTGMLHALAIFPATDGQLLQALLSSIPGSRRSRTP